ncbi:hypothetical protein GGF32_000361 [Allomyces javanicus]|nr:hypothetical protein GGF32_000361 [Allomyces javanicus]
MAEALDATARIPWVAALPVTLRKLNVYGIPVSKGMAASLLDRMPTRAPMARMVLITKTKTVAESVLPEVKAKFDVWEK